jgi:hypothetical protein
MNPRTILRAASVLAVVMMAALPPHPAAAQDGSVGAGVVGGLSGGLTGLYAFYPITGCAMVTLGASRDADGCDVGGVLAGLGGAAAGGFVGGTNAGAGYGMGVGMAAGAATMLLINRVADLPRWADALLVVTGVVVGGLIGADDPPT